MKQSHLYLLTIITFMCSPAVASYSQRALRAMRVLTPQMSQRNFSNVAQLHEEELNTMFEFIKNSEIVIQAKLKASGLPINLRWAWERIIWAEQQVAHAEQDLKELQEHNADEKHQLELQVVDLYNKLDIANMEWELKKQNSKRCNTTEHNENSLLSKCVKARDALSLVQIKLSRIQLKEKFLKQELENEQEYLKDKERAAKNLIEELRARKSTTTT